ncbi:MAG: signal peptidase I [Planctomycetota bacterium]
MAKKSNPKKPTGQAAEKAGSKKDDRDPAEVRAEEFRVGAQRETIEAFVVAFILALLFRAFLAEAFVIPTGSMAPTLMGAHKDLYCEQCGTRFQVGASRERRNPDSKLAVVAGVCPNCRCVNTLDLQNESNHATFNGDRILVNKFSYALSDPERWDVIVFKYPGNPKQNYIKRLVGLPNETLTIRHGDVFVRPTGTNQTDVILRKPPEKLLAMRHLVHNTDQQSPALIAAGYPTRWQPWIEKATSPPTDSWKIERSADGMVATIENADSQSFQWMRYYHRWPTAAQWKTARDGGSLSSVDPYLSRAITDFYAYDSYIHVAASEIYDELPSTRSGSRLERMLNGGYSKGVFKSTFRSGEGLEQFGEDFDVNGQEISGDNVGLDGMHWVGDLILETDVETSEDAKELLLELVEAAVKYRCRIDLETGQATLEINDGEPIPFEDGSVAPSAQCGVQAGSRHRLRFSNCDDQLLLWVDGDVVAFDQTTTFDSRLYRGDEDNHPFYLEAHPLDGAPAAIAVRGGDATVRNLRVDRDKYYIATKNSRGGIYDYNMSQLWSVSGSQSLATIQSWFGDRESWSKKIPWNFRRIVSFEMEDDQFFPMGDNSPESLDARCWAGSKDRIRLPGNVNRDAWKWFDRSYVPRDLLVGKAVLVFWPHSWNAPVPFTPNFSRMKLIR